MSEQALVVEGFLNLVCQEGGYAGPDWEVDGTALFKAVAAHFGAEAIKWDADWRQAPYNAVPGDIPIGRVRITIERIPSEPEATTAKPMASGKNETP